MQSSHDVVIVGARCAGAAVAMLLARAGASVLAVDRSPYGSDTLSTHALLRGGMVQIARWGLEERLRATGVTEVRSTTFHYGGDALRLPIKPRDGVSWLAAPRRTTFDAMLVDEARRSGATIVHGPRVTGLLRDVRDRVVGVDVEDRDGTRRRIRAGLVIGADGRRSMVADAAGARSYRAGTHAAAVIYGYWEGLPADGYHWMFAPNASVGVIPTNDGLTCVFAACPAARFMDDVRRDLEVGYFRLLQEVSPELTEATASARPVGRLRGHAGEAGWMRQSWGPGWALAGDAGCFKDPITAHGMTDALRDAELLARAVLRGSDEALADYQAERDDLSGALFDITDEIASFSWDFARLRALHHEMSQALNREAARLAGLRHAAPEPVARPSGAVLDTGALL